MTWEILNSLESIFNVILTLRKWNCIPLYVFWKSFFKEIPGIFSNIYLTSLPHHGEHWGGSSIEKLDLKWEEGRHLKKSNNTGQERWWFISSILTPEPTWQATANIENKTFCTLSDNSWTTCNTKPSFIKCCLAKLHHLPIPSSQRRWIPFTLTRSLFLSTLLPSLYPQTLRQIQIIDRP